MGNRSQLQDYTEVAGNAANVMVANPYGITCNDCGFINTPQATLTAGNGLVGTVGWNTAGGALGNWIDNKDPLSGALINGAGSFAGYGTGKGLPWGGNAGSLGSELSGKYIEQKSSQEDSKNEKAKCISASG